MLNALSAVMVVLFGYFFFKSLIGDKSDYRTRMEEAKRKAAEYRDRTRTEKRQKEQVAAEDMTQCAVCDAYIPANSTSNCGREDCPW